MSKYDVETAIKSCLVGAIAETQGNMTKVVELTGLSRATCYRLLRKHQIGLREIRDSARRNKLGGLYR